MKKIISLALALIMALGVCVAFASCGGDSTEAGDPTPAPNPVVNKNIGVQSGTTGYYFVNGDEDWGYDGFANIEGKGYSTAQDALQDLINGNIYAVVVDEAPGAALVKAANG